MSAVVEDRAIRPLAPLVIGLSAAGAVLLPSVAQRAVGAAILLAIPFLWFVLSAPHRWLSLFFAAALLTPPLPFPAGNSGPHISVVFAACGLLVGILRADEWRLRMEPVTAWLGVLYTVLVGSVAFALAYSGWIVAAGSLARVLLFGIACYVFLFAAYGPESPHRRICGQLFWLAAGSALFACLDFYFQWPAPAGYGPQFVWLASGVFRRAQGVFYEASTLGNLCAFFLTMTAVEWLRPGHETPVPRFALAAVSPVLATALILSYSRASLVALGIAVATLGLLHHPRLPSRRVVLGPLILLVGGAGVAYMVFPEFASNYWMRVQLSAQYLFSATNGVLSGRLENWQKLSSFLVEHPWHLLLGVGYKTLPYSDVAGSPVIADNMYLSLLAETGVLGLGAFIALNVAILKAGWAARTTFYGAWIFSFWTGQVFQMMSGDLLTYWRVIPIYFWVLAQAIRKERT